ncbi:MULTISPECIES: PopZ family protein [Pseudovibrio]|uniref:PopZ family protein n=1 Tax=Stappiaceae TaxID=2821832 RepID=UPI002365E545|nr:MULTISPECIES: DUF2497 domain-containing protein [Pseudovibrio]MDD7908469.1 DUF2497 domain-containing protein [Pseudovibrio exalbescens]MDX5592669.1 DUF2497 domain-containing protein [Pseudovibrio sp. SPO723]
MGEASKTQEPSMEEILSSIRKIISEEETDSGAGDMDLEEGKDLSQDDLDKLFDSPGGFGSDDDEPEQEVDSVDDVLELTEDAAVEEEKPEMDLVKGMPETADDDRGDISFDGAPEVDADDILETVEQKVEAAAPTLLSESANQAVSSAFNGLANTVLSQNARTLDDLVADMLRPMLKSWLDQHLPDMVERLVKQEIERISRGR